MKKHYFRKTAALLTAALCIFTSLVFAGDAAIASLKVKWVSSTSTAYGKAKIKTYNGTFDGKTGILRSLEFTPGAALVPVVVNRNTNISRYTLPAQLDHYDGLLKTGQVIGGINGGFFNSYGNAEGLQIRNGKLLSTNSFKKDNGQDAGAPYKFYTAGFTESGTLIYGIPNFSITATAGGVTRTAGAFNQLPHAYEGQVWVLNSDYGSYARWDTAYSHLNYYVLALKKTAGSYTVGGSVTGTFVSYKEYTADNASACKLESANFYIIGPKSQVAALASAALSGSGVTVNFKETTGRWATAYNTLRGGNLLVDKGKAVTGGLDASIASKYVARTVLAVKASGEAGLFVFDNSSKQGSGYLAGMPLVNAAQTLADLGYYTAVNLDGGGSSTIAARSGDKTAVKVLNDPSDGSLRPVGNALALVCFIEQDQLINNFETLNFSTVTAGGANAVVRQLKNGAAEHSGVGCAELEYDLTAAAATVRLTQGDVVLPAGATAIVVRINGLSSDVKVQAAFAKDDGTTVTSRAVTLDGDTYREITLNVPEGAVTYTGLTFTRGNGKKKGTVRVDNLVVRRGASPDALAPAITVTPSGTQKGVKGTTLKMSAADNVWGSGVDPKSYEIYVDAAHKASAASYTLTGTVRSMLTKVTYEAADNDGNRTRKYTLLSRSDYKPTAFFKDVKANGWATDYINYCYRAKLMEGDTTSGERRFLGTRSASRAELCATLVNMRKVSVKTYASVKLPYADAASIPSWAAGYVKAAYKLGIMTGTKVDGKLYFYPNRPVTRAEVASAIRGMLPALAGFRPSGAFKDASSIPAWAQDAINDAAAFGIFEGDAEGKFRPAARITRNEIAVILTRLNR